MLPSQSLTIRPSTHWSDRIARGQKAPSAFQWTLQAAAFRWSVLISLREMTISNPMDVDG
jgi:hypothetical protein